VSKKKILWLIAARCGSKSIPDKNIKLLGGYPLISYRIKSALNSKFTNDVWVSTDSEIYANISKEFGATVPFIRPDFLASDEASSMDVVLHSMDFALKNELEYDYIGLLEPTSPFIGSELLDEAINYLFSNKAASAIVATRESRPNSVFVQKNSVFLDDLADNLKTLNKIGRQSFNTEITPSGGFYISKWNDFIENRTFYSEKTLSYLVDDISGLEIDEPLDWQFAEFIVEKQIFDIKKIFR
jgi:CMP-N,N'-diacetyllegionaminic acid synthase